MPSLKDYTTYKTFVALAILGMQAEADQLLKASSAKRAVNRILGELRTISTVLKTVFRGLLLENWTASSASGRYEGVEYVSFSEDLQAACWFARYDSFISEFVAKLKPKAEGFIGEYTPQMDEIMFHYSWIDHLHSLPGPNVFQITQQLEMQLGRQSGELISQLHWNLKSQQEVLLIPDITYKVAPITNYACLPTSDLDKQFRQRPDFIIAPPGLQSLGIQPGERLNLIGIDLPHPPAVCPVCQRRDVEVIYYLARGNLMVYNCHCGQKSFAIAAP